MRPWHAWPVLAPGLITALIALAAPGCTPYERRDGEYYAGAVDPARFPAPYLGEGGSGSRPGAGTFAPVPAFVGGRAVGYYAFPLPAAQAGRPDPLALAGLTLPLAYVFDPQPDQPIPERQRCVPPEGYQFDQQRDAYRMDQQGNLFTALPSAPGYLPLVAVVHVTSNGEPCQDIKSEETLLTRGDVKVPISPAGTGIPDGRVLAWPIIDPAADVLAPGEDPDAERTPEAALGPQQWGFFNHYLLAYLDGGYVPTRGDAGGPRLVAQRLYYPRTVRRPGMTMPGPGQPGEGDDVLEAARGGAGYSPVCQVFSYEPRDPAAPATDAAQIDPATVRDERSYRYCLQLR